MNTRTTSVSLGILLLTGCAYRDIVATDQTVGSTAQFDGLGEHDPVDGSWLVLYQSENVDAPDEEFSMSVHMGPSFGPMLMLPGSAGIPVDDVIPSPDHRRLLVEQSGTLRLLDVESMGWSDLAPAGHQGYDKRHAYPEPPLPVNDHTELYNGRSECYADFSADGRSLLYLDHSVERSRLVVRDLEEGTHHEIDPGPGVLSWSRLMPAGDAVVVRMAVKGSGPTIEGPFWREPLDQTAGCIDPSALSEGTSMVTRVLDREGRELARRPGSYQPMGRGLIRPTETEDGGYWWWRPDLDEETRLPACPGYLIHVDRAAPRLLTFCWALEPSSGRPDVGGPGRLRLERFDDRVEWDDIDFDGSPRADAQGRYVTVEVEEGSVVVDMEQARLISLPGVRVVGVAAGRALVESKRIRLRPGPTRVKIVDLESLRTLKTFWVRAASWMSTRGTGSIVVFGQSVIDMEAARVLAKLPERPRAIDEDGRILLLDPDAPRTGRGMMPRGPLRWYEPASKRE